MGYFRFFIYTLQTFYRSVPYPMHKKNYKNPLNYYLLKVEQIHGDVSKMRVLGQKKLEGAPNAPPPQPL